MNSIDRLLQAADAIQRHAEPDVAEWFQSGLNRYLSSRECRSLDEALGIGSTGRGKPSERSRYGKTLRDNLLRQAYDRIDPDGKPTTRCDGLASEIRDFEARFWPRWEGLEEPPAGCSELRRLLFMAKRTGEPLPTGWRTIYRVVFDY